MFAAGLRSGSKGWKRRVPALVWAALLIVALVPWTAAAALDDHGATAIEGPDGPFDTYISIDNVSVDEGDDLGDASAVFTVTISNYWPPELTSISVLYATWGLGEVDGPTATEGVDYEETNGLLYFTGLGSKTITVPIIGDTIVEANETFYVKLFGDEIPAWEDVFGTATIVDDDVPMCMGQPATHWGTPAAETINGTAGDDVIVGLGGGDTIYAKGGNDVVCAGAGADVVFAGLGNDKVLGQGGPDEVFGAAGVDVVWGGRGRDVVKGGAGKDTIRGGLGADTIYGQKGVDTLYGNGGPDAISGGRGSSDVCKGGIGVDTHMGGCETLVSIP